MRMTVRTALVALVASTALTVLAACGGKPAPREGAGLPPPPETAVPPMGGGPWLDQEPPGTEPVVFAPGIVSSPDFEYSGSFSPDGTEYCFKRLDEGTGTSRLMYTRLSDGRWTAPAVLAFTGEENAGEPCFSPDGDRLYFMWRHPVPDGRPGFPSYFFVDRTELGWSEPAFAGQGMFMSASRDGRIYTTDMTENAARRTYLAEVEVSSGVFTGFERLSIETRLGSQAHPCIAPDGSFLLFDVNGGEYLYAAFRQPDGSWGEPIDLVLHGFDPAAGGATVSPDGAYLFFALREDIWWVDIGAVTALRPGS